MSRTPLHPAREQIELPMVLDCLSDPIRLAIVYQLAQQERVGSELRCGDFNGLSGKSNLAYHFAKLRECGLMLTRVAGTNRFMRLRREDLDARFPGLLDAVLNSAAKEADRLQLIAECDVVETD
ncbi:helix-turn-helix transcriptional regulator [Bradyrhizobium diazoefficiens]|uniref:ArsR/SmtB family transcription factor n=1 Tax=Bradyrhizobium diazoefficiens TaxID=1355477 RepID=UPI00190E2E8A|nr:helix-turn-helix transcriptional regulator [Bradyrhizobium diazoefficiens]MBK3660526.1 helix-turn-helix transcriptional regulator [Bradyrhizobium diazoefficiens]